MIFICWLRTAEAAEVPMKPNRRKSDILPSKGHDTLGRRVEGSLAIFYWILKLSLSCSTLCPVRSIRDHPLLYPILTGGCLLPPLILIHTLGFSRILASHISYPFSLPRRIIPSISPDQTTPETPLPPTNLPYPDVGADPSLSPPLGTSCR